MKNLGVSTGGWEFGLRGKRNPLREGFSLRGRLPGREELGIVKARGRKGPLAGRLFPFLGD